MGGPAANAGGHGQIRRRAHRFASIVCNGASVQLPAAECSAWIKFFDAMRGSQWKYCVHLRSDPCSCSEGSGTTAVSVDCSSGATTITALSPKELGDLKFVDSDWQGNKHSRARCRLALIHASLHRPGVSPRPPQPRRPRRLPHQPPRPLRRPLCSDDHCSSSDHGSSDNHINHSVMRVRTGKQARGFRVRGADTPFVLVNGFLVLC